MLIWNTCYTHTHLLKHTHLALDCLAATKLQRAQAPKLHCWRGNRKFQISFCTNNMNEPYIQYPLVDYRQSVGCVLLVWLWPVLLGKTIICMYVVSVVCQNLRNSPECCRFSCCLSNQPGTKSWLTRLKKGTRRWRGRRGRPKMRRKQHRGGSLRLRGRLGKRSVHWSFLKKHPFLLFFCLLSISLF